MLITTAQVKQILLLSVSTYDASISALIPYVQADLIDYLGNNFCDVQTKYCSGVIKFNAATDSNPDYITDTQNLFVAYGLSTGMDIYIGGTARNSGIYGISTISAGRITLTSADTILNEASTDYFGGNIIYISRVRWPMGLRLYAAQIIWHNIKHVNDNDIQSKSIGPSSITYIPIGSGGYPDYIMAGIKKYKHMEII